MARALAWTRDGNCQIDTCIKIVFQREEHTVALKSYRVNQDKHWYLTKDKAISFCSIVEFLLFSKCAWLDPYFDSLN